MVVSISKTLEHSFHLKIYYTLLLIIFKFKLILYFEGGAGEIFTLFTRIGNFKANYLTNCYRLKVLKYSQYFCETYTMFVLYKYLLPFLPT